MRETALVLRRMATKFCQRRLGTRQPSKARHGGGRRVDYGQFLPLLSTAHAAHGRGRKTVSLAVNVVNLSRAVPSECSAVSVGGAAPPARRPALVERLQLRRVAAPAAFRECCARGFLQSPRGY